MGVWAGFAPDRIVPAGAANAAGAASVALFASRSESGNPLLADWLVDHDAHHIRSHAEAKGRQFECNATATIGITQSTLRL